jgi:hypothetical protein
MFQIVLHQNGFWILCRAQTQHMCGSLPQCNRRYQIGAQIREPRRPLDSAPPSDSWQQTYKSVAPQHSRYRSMRSGHELFEGITLEIDYMKKLHSFIDWQHSKIDSSIRSGDHACIQDWFIHGVPYCVTEHQARTGWFSPISVCVFLGAFLEFRPLQEQFGYSECFSHDLCVKVHRRW